MTIEVQSVFNDISERVAGQVEVVKDPASGALTLNGTGEGRWTYRHHEKEDQCPALSGDGTFEVTFSGSLQPSTFGGNPSVFVMLLAAPGGDQFGGEIGKYVRSESVTCHEDDSTWEEPRILAPLIIGPLGKDLEEFMEGVTITDGAAPAFNMASVTITAKIMPPDDQYRIHGKVFAFKGSSPLFESKVVLGDYAKIGGHGLVIDKLSDSMPDFEDHTTTTDTGDARYEFELERPANKPLRALVVSLLWYDGEGQFAVTSGKEVNGRYIPIYQVACIDHYDDSCIKWEKVDGGYEAEVDFQYGHSSSNQHKNVMDIEAWNMDYNNMGVRMNDAAWTYVNSYKAMKYFESVKGAVGNPLNPVMIDIHNSHLAGCKDETGRDKDSAFFNYQARGSFGGLGSHLEHEEALGGTATICTITSSTSQPDAPINREYHELGHYLQNDLYYPSSNLISGRGTPHAGYANDSTNDSYVEGFAEFAALLVAERYSQLAGGQPRYPLGTHTYNLEQDFRVWGDNVRMFRLDDGRNVPYFSLDRRNDEEFAVAGLLWDLHDSGQEFHVSHMISATNDPTELWAPISQVYNMTKDNVALSGQHILENIRSKKPMNLVDLYGAFSGDVSREDLDMVFISHGAFGDVSKRDLIHAAEESVGPTGSAEAPERLVRSSPHPMLNGSYVSSETDSIINVKFTHREPYSFYDYSYDLNMTKNQPAYFEMPPSYYPSIAQFIPVLQDGKLSGDSSLIINSTEYWNYIYSDPEENAIFKTIESTGVQESVVPISQSSDSTESTSSQPSGCLIATAAFGSELAPQVQLLRNFRDNHILSTASGSSFMNVFNAWYYSFSPQVADYEREQPWLQQIVRIGIYPLLGILQTAEKAYAIVPGEFGSVSAGLVASSLIGAVYFSPIAMSIKQVRRNKLDYRIAILIVAAVSVSVIVALMAGNPEALMATTALLVVSTLGISAIYVSKAIWKLFQLWRK
jgi:hypothetical protein